MTAIAYGAADRAYALNAVGVQTANYAAGANQLVPVDSTGAAVTVTLPAAPPDLTQVAVKFLAGSNTVSVVTSAGDVFDKAGGSTTQALTITGQGIIAQYDASAGIWYVSSDDLPLAQLDARYVLQSSGPIPWYNVKAAAYGAKGDGVSDDTLALNAAVTAAKATGGVVYLPAGTYMVTPPNSSTAAIVLNDGTAGFQSVRFVGDGALVTKIKRLAAGPIFSMSGPSTSTGTTHCKYCSLENLRLDGNGLTGTLMQLYYADDLFFHEVYFGNCPDIVIDTAELWDSRFYNCVWEGNGSATANASTPNVLLRNSAAASGFGSSANNVNQIHFSGCRWEGFHTGAVWIQQGVGNAGNPQQIYFTNCKMECGAINGGPHLLVDANCKSIYVDHLYCYSGGFNTGYSTAQDVITWSAQDSTLENVFIASGAAATVANGVTLNSTVAGQNSVARNITGIYSGAPTGNHIGIGTGTGGFVIDNCHSNETDPSILNAIMDWISNASTVNVLASSVAGDTLKRWVMNANGGMSWGSGSATADVVATRTAAGVFSFTSGILDPQAGTRSTTVANANTITPTFASGTAAQLSDTSRDYMVYFTVGTAGTITLAIGSTNTPANTLINGQTATAGELISFRLPAAWFVKVTLTTATITQKAIAC